MRMRQTKGGYSWRNGKHLPGGGAVLVEDVEVVRRQQLASIDARLDGAQAAQNAYLLDIAHDGHNVQALMGWEG